MSLNTLLSVIILVSFIVTVVLAVGSYTAYKIRERRRPSRGPRATDEEVYFERYVHQPAPVRDAERKGNASLTPRSTSTLQG